MNNENKNENGGFVERAIMLGLNKEGITKELVVGEISTGVFNYLDKEIETIIAPVIKKIEKNIKKKIDKKITEEIIVPIKFKSIKGNIEIKTPHKDLEKLTKIVSQGLNIMLVGTTGSGKTFSARQVAKILNLQFRSISIGMQSTKSDLLGYMDAMGKYRTTGFRECFESGGLFLLDEIDAGNPNVLLQLNTAISNGFCEFGDNVLIQKHENFRVICTANTYGDGMDFSFVGRNQLDKATLDRFVIMDWGIDEKLEKLIIGNDVVHDFLKSVRKKSIDEKMDFIVSTRSGIFIKELLELDKDFDGKDVLDMAFFRGADKAVRDILAGNVKTFLDKLKIFREEEKMAIKEKKRIEKEEFEIKKNEERLKEELKKLQNDDMDIPF